MGGARDAQPKFQPPRRRAETTVPPQSVGGPSEGQLKAGLRGNPAIATAAFPLLPRQLVQEGGREGEIERKRKQEETKRERRERRKKREKQEREGEKESERRSGKRVCV